MNDDPTLIADLIQAGLAPELVGRVANALLAEAVEASKKSYDCRTTSYDVVADRKRQYDRERMRKKREQSATVVRQSYDNSDVARRRTTLHRDSNNTQRREKRLSLSMSESYDLSDSGLKFALGKGWTETHAREEFQRFKDHHLANGVTRRDWEASWRNWVTSPYQNGGGNGPHRQGGNGGDAFKDVFDRLERHFAGQDGGGDEVGEAPLRVLPQARR